MELAENTITQELRQSFQRFWNDNLLVEEQRGGVVLSLPVMTATGWQVVFRLTELTPGRWELSDAGKTLDLEYASTPRSFKDRLASICTFYKLEQRGLQLTKIVSDPKNVVDVQVFAEGLVAVSHAVALLEPQVKSQINRVLESRVEDFFTSTGRKTIRSHTLSGRVEAEITVDFFVDGEIPLAVETVRRTKQLLPYMEQWGWRWTDLKNMHPNMTRAMVYDPDQHWDPGLLRLGENICDAFIPYSQTAGLGDYLGKEKEAV
jgi:hypothetical protein